MRKNLRIAWAFLGVEERRRWALLVLLALVVAGLEAFGASAVYLLIRLIDEPAAATGLPLIGPIGVSLGLEGAALVSGACAAVALFFAAKNALMIGIHAVQYDRIYASANTLATRLLKGYLAAPITFHFARNSAETIRNVGNAVDIVFRIVLTSAVTATTEGLIAAAVLGVLLATAPVETMIAVLVLGAIMGFLMRLTQWRFQAYGEQVQDLSRRGLQSLQQSLGGLKEVKVLGREAYFLGEYADIRATLSKVLWRFDVLSQLPRLALETVFVLAISAVVIYLAWQGGAGKAAVPLVGLYAYAGLRLMPSAHRLVNALNMLRYGSAAIAQIAKDLGQVERDAPPPMPAASPGAFAFGDAIR
ncbi:MAG: hypothetical protein FJX47_06005, partial [Alphaproteobacteria bacterium]|nr:hypothetical protein [Alphaproteobacteria bacterium]